MFVHQFFVKGLAHSSYLLGGATTCAIIDPRRDIDVYIRAARAMGMKITHILETHLHADFISGHMDLAAQTGAVIYAPKAGKCAFKHIAVADGHTFDIEDLTIRVLETPGHTPEHVSYVVIDRSRGSDPAAVFCGDTLFVGDVGRPDLFPGIAESLAAKLYDSLHKKLLILPPFCSVYPAHGAGSLCGRAMGAMRTSTIGYEKKYNGALNIRDKKKFISALTTNMPPAPDHFSRCSAVNGKGPALVDRLPSLKSLEPAAFKKCMRQKNTIVLDCRPTTAFGGGHVPGSYHIDFGSNFSTFAGWILPAGMQLMLVTESPEQAADAAVLLRRVGHDRITGFLDGGMYEWAKAGFAFDTVPQLSVQQLQARIKRCERFTLLDVRTAREFEAGHIDGAVNIPMPDLRMRFKEIATSLPVVVICNTGHRSSMATSLLKQRGFTCVFNVAGGMTSYAAAGLSGPCALCLQLHGPRV
jgi:glyoxylase-like metal-dependent hydrolase (beta-lactamase superfamily II)/rhodanese-related sulfurtransferase